MATPAHTLLDIMKLNGNDTAIPLIEEASKAAPEVMAFPMRTIKGTSFTTGKRTVLPTTGFANANGGIPLSKSTFAQILVQTFIYSGVVGVAKAVAMANEDGPEALLAIEAIGVGESALQGIGRQIWYGGTNGDGFPGLKALLPFGTASSKGDPLVVNAAGTTASTASSVYLVRFGERDCQLVGGMSKGFELGDWYEHMLEDASDSTKVIPSFVADLTAWIGLAVYSEDAARRIANLTADSGKGLTDALLAQAVGNFPSGKKPDAIFASRRSVTQLQTDRASKVSLQGNGKGGTLGGGSAYVPRPTDFEGIPIIETESIGNTDAIES